MSVFLYPGGHQPFVMAGRVTISIELELGWGRHHLPGDDKYDIISKNREIETETLNQLLNWSERYEVPISFDVVDHLLHTECSGDHEGPHPPDWFDADPGGTVNSDPLFYGSDLISLIRDSPIDHEICSHTYSHILTDEFNNEVIRWELERIRKVFEPIDLSPPTSIVLPQHRSVPYEILAEFDYDIIRLPVPRTPNGSNDLRKNVSILSRVVGRRHPVIRPSKPNSVIETYSTYEPSLTAPFLPKGQIQPHVAFRWMPIKVGKRLHQHYLRRGVQRASNNDSFVHYWTHLYNMSNHFQRPLIKDFMGYLGEKSNSREISILRMKDIREVIK